MTYTSFLPVDERRSTPRKRFPWLLTAFALTYLLTGAASYLYYGPFARIAGLPAWAFGVGVLSLIVSMACSLELDKYSPLVAAGLMLFIYPYFGFLNTITGASESPFHPELYEALLSSGILTVAGVAGPLMTAAGMVGAVERKLRSTRRR
ncbi:hypothetical protein G3A43_07660 [Paraburkholderia aspalathi]|nr:hypothetical protein [Paraburkholderia aspalathi]MBK3780131.1 hypothetical protein [Paraburkholderia aspalathi]